MLTEKDLQEYEEQGYLVVKNFLTTKETEMLKTECQSLVNKMEMKDQPSFIISGDKQVGDDYFLTSGDKIRFFFEEKAFDGSGKTVVDRHEALDKIGHALHWMNPIFKAITFSDKVKAIASDLQFVDPVVVQSMYIFKHPKISNEVQPHQDATYLHTEPVSCTGFWLPLEDATIKNGCLCFIPGSHKGNLSRRMVRNPDAKGSLLIYTGPEEEYKHNLFVPVPAKKGSLVIIHGLVVHKSGLNMSNTSRDVYTFHITENFQAKYSPENWLQPTTNLPFPFLYRVSSI